MSMWYEVHRPCSLSDCVLDHLHEDARCLLLHAASQESLPNLLLWGPPGTGKSTIAQVLANKDRFTVNMFNGVDLEKQGVGFLNRLIQSTSLYHGRRCFVIDEIHVARPTIQHAVRSMIDDAPVPISWLFTCNDVNAVDQALRSRLLEISCAYSSVASRERHLDGIARRYADILNAEKLTAPREQLREIAEQFYPDVRAGINALQIKYSSLKAA
jgi:putative ATPase